MFRNVTELRRFLDQALLAAGEVRTFEKGKFEIVKIGSMTIGRASYEPGWKWSVHVGAATGATLCEVEHVGLVVSGCAACRMKDGRYHEMRAGDLFYIGPGHDSWAVGLNGRFPSTVGVVNPFACAIRVNLCLSVAKEHRPIFRASFRCRFGLP